jgi:hypothetical protein
MDEPGRGLGLENGGRRRLRGQAGGQAVPFEAAMDAAARQVGVEAAPHRLDDVVERQREALAQLNDQGFFPFTDRGSNGRVPRRVELHHLTEYLSAKLRVYFLTSPKF